MLLEIVWNVDPEIFSIFGRGIRWYGLLFALSFIVGQYVLNWAYPRDDVKLILVEKSAIYIIIGTILGARLGHVFFYEPSYYLSHPSEILQVWKGGLASHGAGFGLFLACYLYFRKYKKELPSYLWVLDKVVLVVAIAGALIRFGNFMNSEIVGKPTNSPTAVLFANPVEYQYESDNFITDVTLTPNGNYINRNNIEHPEYEINFTFHPSVDSASIKRHLIKNIIPQLTKPSSDQHFIPIAGTTITTKGKHTYAIQAMGVPRHPAQLYEAFSCVLLFLLLMYLNKNRILPQGGLFGVFMIWVFTLRFFYEFIKENQVNWENANILNQGQKLSVPMVILGIAVLIYAYINQKKLASKNK